MSPYRIAIVGGGPMCTYALERLAALLGESPPAGEVVVAVYERSGAFGAGETHHDGQAPTSALNRVASQIAFAADESNAEAGALLPRPLRPTFYEWARETHARTGDPRFDYAPHDVPPRCMHGLALRDMFARYFALLCALPGVRVELHDREVIDIERVGGRFRLHAGSEIAPFEADQVLLATGPSRRRPALPPGAAGDAAIAAAWTRYVPHPYPLHRQLDESAVPPGCRLGMIGMGLTAIDAILFLTEGRGGRFVESDDGLHYRPSGREPEVIVVAGTSGMFTWCRPRNEKALDGTGRGHVGMEHRSVFLTDAAIAALRSRAGRPARIHDQIVLQIDFDRHVMPLIVMEMAYVHYVTVLGPDCAAALRDGAAAAHARFLEEPDRDQDAAIESLLAPMRAICAPALADAGLADFDWRRLFDPLPATGPGRDWQASLIDFMRCDNLAAREGNLRNPVKAACDGVWRDLRSVLAGVVDFGGLTAESHRRFCEVHFRRYTRMSNGAGLDAMRRIQALLECGRIDASVGPGPETEVMPDGCGFRIRGHLTGLVREVEILAEGRVPVFDPAREERPLYPNLLRRGLIRHWRNPGEEGGFFMPGAVDITRRYRAVDADGREAPNMTLFGAPVEGVAFFQLSTARPYANSPVMNLAVRWANACVAALREAQART